MTLAIIPECYGDTALIECLGFTKPNHQKGIGNVHKTIVERYAGQKAIGIIDNDPKTSKEIKSFPIVKRTDYLILKNIPGTWHYFIVIIPALERWLVNCEEIANISRTNYKLPEDFNDFKKFVKKKKVNENPHFVLYLKALKRANPEPIATLKSWLDELVL